MGRLPRPTGDDLIYHAINRGNYRADVLGPEGERDMFLGDLARIKARYPFALFGYCLMSNHFPDRHGFWGRFVKSLQNTASRRFSVAFHGLGNGRRLC